MRLRIPGLLFLLFLSLFVLIFLALLLLGLGLVLLTAFVSHVILPEMSAPATGPGAVSRRESPGRAFVRTRARGRHDRV